MKAYTFATHLKYLLSRKKVHSPDREGELVLASYNVRYYNDDRDLGDHHWFRRARFCLKNIEKIRPDVLCLQEVKPPQFSYLKKHLKGYAAVITYRDDGDLSEGCPIFFDAKRFVLVKRGTFWLSETPDKMSKSWDSRHYRIATYLTLRDRDGSLLTVYNTHPDYVLEDTRIRQLRVVADYVRQDLEQGTSRIFLTGDFNAVKGEPCLEPFEEMLRDSKDFKGDVFGATFNDFGKVKEDDLKNGIDFIYLPKDAELLETGVVKDVYGGIYPSDHYPIYCRIRL